MGSPEVLLRRMFSTKARVAVVVSLVVALAVATSFVFSDVVFAQNEEFSNGTEILVPGANTSGRAAPSPSTINVSGMTGNVTDVNVAISGISHTNPDDIDVLLVGPAGQNVRLMADVGGTGDVSGLDISFDDEAAGSLPDSTLLAAGTYKPTKGGAGADTFTGSGASAPFGETLSVFDDGDPNGEWKLFVVDDTSSNIGGISGGWSIEIETDNDPPEITTVNAEPAEEGSPASVSVTATDAQNDALTYSFDCDGDGDFGGERDIPGQPENIGECVFDDDGIYTVGVSVSDGKTNGVDADEATVSISNVAPTADFGDDGPVNEGGAATVSFTNALDPSLTDMNAGLRYEYACDGTFESAPDYDAASTEASATCVFDDEGEFVVAGRIVDKDGGATSYTTTVSVANVAPVVSEVEAASVDENASTGEISFTVGDAGNDEISVSGESSDVSLVPDENIVFGGAGENRTVTITPAGNKNGESRIKVTADDGDGGVSSVEFTLTVFPVNQSPVADSVSPAAVVEDEPGNEIEINLRESVSDVETADGFLTYEIEEPGVGTLAPKMDGGSEVPGVFVFVPPPDYDTGSGTLDLEYTATDRGDPDSCADPDPTTNRDGCDTPKTSEAATVSITVIPANEAPVAADDPSGDAYYEVDEDAAGGLVVGAADGVLANDSDPDGGVASLTAVKVSDPARGEVVLEEDGSFTYTPDENFNGLDSFTYAASDGTNESEAATVRIRVAPVNDAPTAAGIEAATREDTPANIDVLDGAGDADGDELSVVIVSQPANGRATVNGDGTVRYAPRANYNGGDSFTYRVSDGEAESAPAAVNVAVSAVNDAPVARPDFALSMSSRTVEINALSNDTDPDGDALSASIVSQPAKGRVVQTQSGNFEYTPPRNFTGVTYFLYRASDGNGGSDVSFVILAVVRL